MRFTILFVMFFDPSFKMTTGFTPILLELQQAYIYIYIYIMAHHFILLRLNPFDLRVDTEGWWFEHSVSWLPVCLPAEGAKIVSWPCLSSLRG